MQEIRSRCQEGIRISNTKLSMSRIEESTTSRKRRAQGQTSDNLPRYRHVAGSIKEKIISGEYPVGSLLPTEAKLCELFGVSRHTVRAALKELAQVSLVMTRQGSGTIVLATDSRPKITHSMSSVSEIFQYTGDTRVEVCRVYRERADHDLAELIHCEENHLWLVAEIRRHDRTFGRAIGYAHVYIDGIYDRIEKLLNKNMSSVPDLLEREYGLKISRITQEISACNLSKAEADLLSVDEHSAGLHIIRRFFDEHDKIVQFSSSLYPGDMFRYVMNLKEERLY